MDVELDMDVDLDLDLGEAGVSAGAACGGIPLMTRITSRTLTVPIEEISKEQGVIKNA